MKGCNALDGGLVQRCMNDRCMGLWMYEFLIGLI